MDFITILLTAAKNAKISGALLVAICTFESSGFTQNYNYQDGGSPSVGICQIKEATAKMLGFKGTEKELMKPSVNAKWAALYLKYQSKRYGEEDWMRIVASYNAGSFLESKKNPGCPRNLKYVRKIQQILAEDLRDRLSCTNRELAEIP